MLHKLASAALTVVVSLGFTSLVNIHTVAAEGPVMDPPGNNGTIKIAETSVEGEEESNANDPHIVGCSLNVKFYGYDKGARTATVTFESHAPTPGTLVSPLGAQPVAFTGGGPGDQLDHTATYTLNFTGEPAEQGYHVKVTVNADGSQGSDKKSKVIWVEGCEPEEPQGVPSSAVSLVCPTNTYKLTVSNTGTTELSVQINGVDRKIAVGGAAITADFNVGDVLTVKVDGTPVTVEGKVLNNFKLVTCQGMGSTVTTNNTTNTTTNVVASTGFGAGAATDVESLPVTSGSSAQAAGVIMTLGTILAAAGAYLTRSRSGLSI